MRGGLSRHLPDPAPADVLVVGAGPAGAATARLLARRGIRVTALERTHFETPRVGESLSPEVRDPLQRLGLWSAFLALDPLPSWGTRSVWGDDQPQSHSHLASPFGCGWHVDRRAFDEMLADAASAAGADVRKGVRVVGARWRDGRWCVDAVTDGASAGCATLLTARIIVDATGRAANIARSLGGRRVLFDRLVGVAMPFAGPARNARGHLLIEAVRDGWWYTAPIPDRDGGPAGGFMAMLMTDADLWGRSGGVPGDRWHRLLRQAEATQARLRGSRGTAVPRPHSAVSQRLLAGLRPDSGPWLAVGDSAMSVDPISGSGVLRALRSAGAVAAAVETALEHPARAAEALREHERVRDAECTTYLIERAAYYAAETRFASPFWTRRRPAVPARARRGAVVP